MECGIIGATEAGRMIEMARQELQAAIEELNAYQIEQITAYSHQSVDSWVTVIEDTLSLRPLDKTAKKNRSMS